MSGFVDVLFTTGAGWTLIVVGNAAGFAFALIVLATSVVALPMLIDRDVSVGTVVKTSIKAFRRNPVAISVWGLIVAVSMAVGGLLFLVGLIAVFPILGHATWHLYRRLVEPQSRYTV